MRKRRGCIQTKVVFSGLQTLWQKTIEPKYLHLRSTISGKNLRWLGQKWVGLFRPRILCVYYQILFQFVCWKKQGMKFASPLNNKQAWHDDQSWIELIEGFLRIGFWQSQLGLFDGLGGRTIWDWRLYKHLGLGKVLGGVFRCFASALSPWQIATRTFWWGHRRLTIKQLIRPPDHIVAAHQNNLNRLTIIIRWSRNVPAGLI